jgi:excinuclease ABC subunit B
LETGDIQKDMESMSTKELEKLVASITKKMHKAAAELNFEQAAQLRDQMMEVKKYLQDK